MALFTEGLSTECRHRGASKYRVSEMWPKSSRQRKDLRCHQGGLWGVGVPRGAQGPLMACNPGSVGALSCLLGTQTVVFLGPGTRREVRWEPTSGLSIRGRANRHRQEGGWTSMGGCGQEWMGMDGHGSEWVGIDGSEQLDHVGRNEQCGWAWVSMGGRRRACTGGQACWLTGFTQGPARSSAGHCGLRAAPHLLAAYSSRRYRV